MNRIAKILFFLIILSFLFDSCNRDYDSNLRGKWQLKAIKINGITKTVDSIFFNFDNLVFTMQNVLHPTQTIGVIGTFKQQKDTLIIEFPDTNHGNKDQLSNYFQWKDSIRSFKIIGLSSNRLSLKDNISTLILQKY